MSNIKDHFTYEIHETLDGSPTMRIADGEAMHSLDGAFSETCYIYQPTLAAALTAASPATLSLGLGLGYNEILWAGLACKSGQKNCQLHSFESEAWLRQQFFQWVNGHHSDLASTYQKILALVSAVVAVPASDIQDFLADQLRSNNLQIHPALTSATQLAGQFHGILFDAFSMKTNPELWSQEFLDSFLYQWAAPNCTFSTYAATGNLNRALVKNNFTVEKIKGFGRKREATRASR